jgi:hypothetical protein
MLEHERAEYVRDLRLAKIFPWTKYVEREWKFLTNRKLRMYFACSFSNMFHGVNG